MTFLTTLPRALKRTIPSMIAAALMSVATSACAVNPTSASDLIAADNDSSVVFHTAGGKLTASFYHTINKPLAQISGEFEQVDYRQLADNHYLVIAHNKQNNSLEHYSYRDNQFTLINRMVEPNHALEGVCLYQTESAIFAYILKDQANVEQRLIFNRSQQQAQQKLIRHLPMSHNITACAVNDNNQQIYLAEETMGVWQFDARQEYAQSRQAVNLMAPFGELNSEIKALTLLADGSLIISQTELKKVAIAPSANVDSHKKSTLVWVDVKGEEVELFNAKRLNETQILLNTYDSKARDSKLAWQQQTVDLVKQKTTKPLRFKQITATIETTPVARMGDAADDPAIWLNPTNSEASRILATDKKSGLAVYDLQGKQLQFIATGRINNVDLRHDFTLNQQTISLAAASNRDNNSITFYAIDSTGQVSQLNDVATNLNEVYGLCMYKHDDQYFVFINDKDGRYQQYDISSANNQIKGELVAEFNTINQPEGCVANDNTGDLFVGVEDEGIWHTQLKPTAGKLTQIAGLTDKVVDDIEGMALYLTDNINTSYLVVSSQGNNSFAVYQAKAPFNYIDSFRVTAAFEKNVDGASETDGLDLVSGFYNTDFPEGLLVVQDGRNIMPKQAQNFKLVSFKQIKQQLNLK